MRTVPLPSVILAQAGIHGPEHGHRRRSPAPSRVGPSMRRRIALKSTSNRHRVRHQAGSTPTSKGTSAAIVRLAPRSRILLSIHAVRVGSTARSFRDHGTSFSGEIRSSGPRAPRRRARPPVLSTRRTPPARQAPRTGRRRPPRDAGTDHLRRHRRPARTLRRRRDGAGAGGGCDHPGARGRAAGAHRLVRGGRPGPQRGGACTGRTALSGPQHGPERVRRRGRLRDERAVRPPSHRPARSGR